MPSIPAKTEAIVRNLARLYATNSQDNIVELLVRSKAEVVESSFDNWNGGTYGYTLRLEAPAHLYGAVEESLEQLEKELLDRAKPFLRGFENEFLEGVVISLELEADDKWRENALAWLSTRSGTPAADPMPEFDFFISHASEDKVELVRPLATSLRAQNAKVWYDEFELRIGDSLRQSIDRGLAKSRFGIVILSPAFFAKNWPQYELDGLTSRQMVGRKVILPVWHKVSREEILRYSPSLADMLAFQSVKMSVTEMVKELINLVQPQTAQG